MGLFRDCVLRSNDNEIGRHLNNVILDQIQMEREGDSIDRGTIRSCVYMLEGLYETDEELETEKLYLTSFEGVHLYIHPHSKALWGIDLLIVLI